MYQLTSDPDIVLIAATRTNVPRGHRLWEEYEAWLAEGHQPAPLARTLDELIAETKARISAWLDQIVQARGYDSIVSCASYAASTNATFRAEAEAAIAWRDAVYATGYEILNDIPDDLTAPEQVLALMPLPSEFGWPE